jgi:hypothetical protein
VYLTRGPLSIVTTVYTETWGYQINRVRAAGGVKETSRCESHPSPKRNH